MFSKTLIAAFGLLAVANAHLAIQVPTPIPGTETKSPLDASGSDFPCHGADLTQGTVTDMKAGSSYPLQFNLGQGANTAVHGGGSCQISLTYETDKAKQKDPANWKVIKSYIGGCPTDAMGNLPTSVQCPDKSPSCVNAFDFQIPSEVQNGNAILAWTWFNNVGNREMYMNCAKVTISGGANQLSSLPSLFVANLASINQCKTSENFNTDFPNPGKYVQKDSTMNYPLKAPVGSCGSGSGSAGVAASPASGSSGSSGASPAAASSPAVVASANNGQYTGVGAPSPKAAAPAKQTQTVAGASAQGAAPASTLATQVVPAAASTPTAAPAAAQSPAAQAPAAAAPAASSSGSGSCAAGSVACTASGFYCIDATHFGQCAFGCAVPMQMAAGTNCANGAVTFASKRSTSLRHAMKHMRRQIL